MAAAAAFAGACLSAHAAPCPSAPSAVLSTYLSGGANATCTVLDKTISGMSITNVTPTNFIEPMFFPGVSPVTVSNNPGLSFQSMGSAIGTGPNTFTITYTITAPASDPMTDASLAINGTLFATSPAAFQVSETLSNGASLFASDLSFDRQRDLRADDEPHRHRFGHGDQWDPVFRHKSVFGDPHPGAGADIAGSARRQSLGARFGQAATARVIAGCWRGTDFATVEGIGLGPPAVKPAASIAARGAALRRLSFLSLPRSWLPAGRAY